MDARDEETLKGLSWAAVDMAVDRDWSIFRRFDELNLLNLLLLQDDIHKLDAKLKRSTDHGTADETWKDLKLKLGEYNKALVDFTRLLDLETPDDQQLRLLREKLDSMAKQQVMLPHNSLSNWDQSQEDDFIMLRSDIDRGTKLIPHLSMIKSMVKREIWGRHKEQTIPTSVVADGSSSRTTVVPFRLPKPEATSKAQRTRRDARVNRIIMAVGGGCALVVPTIIMTKVNDVNANLIITSLAVLAFGIAFGWYASDSTGKDVLGTTVAYAAVLVVFIGTSMASVGEDAPNTASTNNTTTTE